jgi:hypothetical protein
MPIATITHQLGVGEVYHNPELEGHLPDIPCNNKGKSVNSTLTKTQSVPHTIIIFNTRCLLGTKIINAM